MMTETRQAEPDTGSGLTDAQARQLLEAVGPNELVLHRKTRVATIVIRQLRDAVVGVCWWR
jgi:hypothetical protein